MGKNDFMMRKLQNKISSYDGFILYGAGYISQLLIERLTEENAMPCYCVVTDKMNNPEKIREVSVYTIEEKKEELRRKNILVIISVSGKYEAKVWEILNKNEITNVVSVFEFYCNFDMYKEFYLDREFAWYASRVKEWYFEWKRKELDEAFWEERESNDSIVLVLHYLTPRVVKIAKALKESGKRLTVLVNEGEISQPTYAIWCGQLEEICTCNFYSSLEELLFLLLQNKGAIMHIFSSPWHIQIPYILVKNQEHIGRIAFEDYDIANGFYTNFDEDTLRMERYCLENARGICYREFSLEYLTDSLGIDIKGKTIRFLDYCIGEKNDPGIGSDELSLCYSGTVVCGEEWPDCPFEISASFIDMCERNKCHLHIYPTIWDESRYAYFIEKDKKSCYFHFHKPMAFEKLFDVLPGYDYGIVPVRDDIWEHEESGYNTKYKYIYAGTNKFFDYIDAGLPVIAAMPLNMAEYLEERGVLLKWTNGQYDFAHLRLVKENMKKKVDKVREDLAVKKHIGELLEFYKSL